MSAKTIICSCCARPLSLPVGTDPLECPACGSLNVRPEVEGPLLADLTRAIEERLACDFVSAEESYTQVLRGYPHNAEALWGKLLCHYGVEYVTDPKTGKRIPTVHTVRPRPMKLHADFCAACRYAHADIRAQYEADAAYVDRAQSTIRDLAKKCPPYDVFLCHKATKPGSEDKTQDYDRAKDIYHYLKDRGVHVFFAPESLKSMAGANYEAGIYHALHTAKVMLVICSDASYLTSAWVRSEWSRYLELMDGDDARRLIPLFYGGFTAAQLPEDIRERHLHGLSAEAPDAMDSLMRALQELHIVPDPPKPVPKPTPDDPIKPTPPKPRPGEIVNKPTPEVQMPTAQTVTIEFPQPLPVCPGTGDCTQCAYYLECVKVKKLKLKVGKGWSKRVKWGTTKTLKVKTPTPITIIDPSARIEAVKFLIEDESIWYSILLLVSFFSGAFLLLCVEEIFHIDLTPVIFLSTCATTLLLGMLSLVIYLLHKTKDEYSLEAVIYPGHRYKIDHGLIFTDLDP